MSSHLLDTPAVTHTDDNTHTKNTTHLHVGTMLRAQVHKQGFQKKKKNHLTGSTLKRLTVGPLFLVSLSLWLAIIIIY